MGPRTLVSTFCIDWVLVGVGGVYTRVYAMVHTMVYQILKGEVRLNHYSECLGSRGEVRLTHQSVWEVGQHCKQIEK